MEAKVKNNPIIKKWLWLRYRMNVTYLCTQIHLQNKSLHIGPTVFIYYVKGISM